MGLSEEQEKLRNQYLNEIKKLDPEVLASELAFMLVMIPFLPVKRILEQLKNNSKIVKNNKRIVARNKKLARLSELCLKKRLTKTDSKEFYRLCKVLGIDIDSLLESNELATCS